MNNKQLERARRTLYVTGYNPKFTTKRLLEELFMQGGPVVDLTMLENHAYVLFNDEESVSYCLALFKDLELHGNKLTLHSKSKDRSKFNYLKYLMKVRDKLMSEYCKIPPPNLPPKKMPEQLPYSELPKKLRFTNKKRRRKNVQQNHISKRTVVRHKNSPRKRH